MSQELICIICPKGCHISVDENLNVTGNTCKRGEAYAKEEVTSPKRNVTSTVKINSILQHQCPVKTSMAVGKDQVFDVMKEIKKVSISAPVHLGDVIIENVLGTGSNIVACKDILK